MRRILKKKQLEVLENFKTEFKAKNGRDACYEDLRKEKVYHDVKVALIEEQHGLCCYCTNQIEEYNSHIEHFIPQSLDCTKDLDYSNIMVSCNGYKEKRLNCGHKKDNYYDEKLISPLEEDCEENFKYSENGEIMTDETNMRGKETIKRLALDSYLLTRARNTAIFLSGLFDEDFIEKKEHLINYYSNPKDGKLERFSPAILYCLKR